jgi:hypothetical protein
VAWTGNRGNGGDRNGGLKMGYTAVEKPSRKIIEKHF